MCKSTDDSFGITVPLTPVLPPIENWYVVAGTISTGTCSIYSSWKNYLAESKPISTTPPSSLSTAEKKKEATVNAAKAIEVAAFPTMAQTIVYIKSFKRQSPKSKSSSSSPASSISRSTIAGEGIIPSNSPPDDSKSSGLQGTAGAASDSDTSRDSHLSHPHKRRIYKSAMKTVQAIAEGDGCHNDSSNDDRAATDAKPSPSPIPSESPIKKRKTEIGTSQSSIPIFTKRLTMSQTSETIDIGAPTRMESNTSSLDALAMAASASTSEKFGESTTSDENKNAAATRTVASASIPATTIGSTCRRTEDIIRRGATHLMSPREIILPGMAQLPENPMRRLSDRPSPSIIASNIATRNSVTPKQHQTIMQQLKEEQQFQLQQQVEQNRQRRNKSLTSSLIIPKVPTTLLTSSFNIPEVPKGFVPAPAEHPNIISRSINDLKSSLDRKIWRSSLPSVPSIVLQSAANPLSLGSYPLGNFPHQLQHLPQHLQQASTYRTSPHLQALQLQPPHNLLNHHLLSSGAFRHHHHLQQQQQQQYYQYPQAIDLASCTSGTSDCDHSEVTLKCRNGPSSRASSPRLGTIYATKNPEDSLQQKTPERDHRDE
jgi:hypothetical protein